MGKPAPFQRPAINLGGGPKKDWVEAEVQNLSPGDIVRGRGRVVEVRPADNPTTDRFVEVVFQNDEHEVTFERTETVIAFTTV